jgi:hypothetical protein
MQTTTSDRHATSSALPAAAAVVTHAVADYDAWRRVFDDHAGARTRAGILHTHVNRSADDPNLVSVYVAARDLASLRAFLADEDLKAVMMRGGVKAPPTITLITPVEDMTVRDRPLAGVIVAHSVSSYETWKQAFDADAGPRAQAGVLGHAVNRSVEDPSLVVVYLQASSLDQLRGFVGSPRLKETMAKAGVQGAPRIAFVQGADWGP